MSNPRNAALAMLLLAITGCGKALKVGPTQKYKSISEALAACGNKTCTLTIDADYVGPESANPAISITPDGEITVTTGNASTSAPGSAAITGSGNSVSVNCGEASR